MWLFVLLLVVCVAAYFVGGAIASALPMWLGIPLTVVVIFWLWPSDRKERP
jgi:hypothetical protein